MYYGWGEFDGLSGEREQEVGMGSQRKAVWCIMGMKAIRWGKNEASCVENWVKVEKPLKCAVTKARGAWEAGELRNKKFWCRPWNWILAGQRMRWGCAAGTARF